MPRDVEEQLSQEYFRGTLEYVLGISGDFPTKQFIIRHLLTSLHLRMTQKQALVVIEQYLANNKLRSQKATVLVEILREDITKNDVVQRIISVVTELSRDVNILAILERLAFTRNFSWSIPSIPAIRGICEFADSAQILEVGAGLGLWAALIRANGGNIIPTDSFTTHGTSLENTFLEVVPRDAIAAVEEFPTEVLLMCWPPQNESCAHDALQRFQGNKFVYIGQERGGCTAEDEFFDLLEKEWNLTDMSHLHLNWKQYPDYMFFCTRKLAQAEEDPDPTDSVVEEFLVSSDVED